MDRVLVVISDTDMRLYDQSVCPIECLCNSVQV